MRLGEYLTAINHSKENLFDTEDITIEKEYSPYIINRCLSNFPDTIMQANEMNFWCGVDKKMHFDFLVHSIRKRKRFSKWLKDIKPEEFEAVKNYFGYSDRKTKEVMTILSKNDINNIKKDIDTGGKK